jgi:Holliday junction resolvase RusA-like endonuclease
MLFKIEVKPQVKERPRLGRRRKAYTPERTLVFEQAVRDAVAEAKVSFGDAPVGVEIWIEADCLWVDVYELEESVRPVGIRGDIDNYIKSVCDGLQPVAFDDDRQVEELLVHFRGVPRQNRYSKRP